MFCDFIATRAYNIATGSFGNLGCSGGDTISAFKYIIANGGIDKASYYPYKAKVTDATDATEVPLLCVEYVKVIASRDGGSSSLVPKLLFSVPV